MTHNKKYPLWHLLSVIYLHTSTASPFHMSLHIWLRAYSLTVLHKKDLFKKEYALTGNRTRAICLEGKYSTSILLTLAKRKGRSGFEPKTYWSAVNCSTAELTPLSDNEASATGFEPARAEPTRFQVWLLNHSDKLTTSLCLINNKINKS